MCTQATRIDSRTHNSGATSTYLITLYRSRSAAMDLYPDEKTQRANLRKKLKIGYLQSIFADSTGDRLSKDGLDRYSLS